MALTISSVNKKVSGNRKTVIANVTFDSSYPTGGEALTPANLTLARIDHFTAERSAAGGFYPYDRTNQKLLIFAAGGTEAANASDQSAVTVRVRAEGV